MPPRIYVPAPEADLDYPADDACGCVRARVALDRLRRPPSFKRWRPAKHPPAWPMLPAPTPTDTSLVAHGTDAIVWQIGRSLAHETYESNLDLVRIDTLCVPNSPGTDWLISQPEKFVRRAGQRLLSSDLRDRVELFEIYEQWHLAHQLNVAIHTIDDGCPVAALAPDLQFSWLSLFSTLVEELRRVRAGKPISTALKHAATTIAARTGLTFAIKQLATGAAVCFWSATTALAFGIVGGVLGAWLGGNLARWLNRRGFEAACREFVARMKLANLRIRRYTRAHHDQVRAARTQSRGRTRKQHHINERRLQRARRLLNAKVRGLIKQYQRNCLAQIKRRSDVLAKGKNRMLGIVHRSSFARWLPQLAFDLPQALEDAYAYEMEKLETMKSALITGSEQQRLSAWLNAFEASGMHINALTRINAAFCEQLEALIELRDRLVGRAERRQAAMERIAALELAQQVTEITLSYRRKCEEELKAVDGELALVRQKGRDVGLTVKASAASTSAHATKKRPFRKSRADTRKHMTSTAP